MVWLTLSARWAVRSVGFIISILEHCEWSFGVLVVRENAFWMRALN